MTWADRLLKRDRNQSEKPRFILRAKKSTQSGGNLPSLRRWSGFIAAKKRGLTPPGSQKDGAIKRISLILR